MKAGHTYVKVGYAYFCIYYFLLELHTKACLTAIILGLTFLLEKSHILRDRQTRVQILPLLPSGPVTLEKGLNLSEPQFPHL